MAHRWTKCGRARPVSGGNTSGRPRTSGAPARDPRPGTAAGETARQSRNRLIRTAVLAVTRSPPGRVANTLVTISRGSMKRSFPPGATVPR